MPAKIDRMSKMAILCGPSGAAFCEKGQTASSTDDAPTPRAVTFFTKAHSKNALRRPTMNSRIASLATCSVISSGYCRPPMALLEDDLATKPVLKDSGEALTFRRHRKRARESNLALYPVSF